MNFFTKALIKKQLKGVPEAEVEKLMVILEKNPEFFTKMAQDVQGKVKAGMSQEEAAKAFASENEEELKKILAN